MTRIKITLGYVHPGWVRHEFVDSMLRMLGDGRYEVSMVQMESGTNVQKARNDCVRWFLANTDSDYFFSVDTDMTWAPDVPARLIAREEPIVSAYYLGRGQDGKAFPVGLKWGDELARTMVYLTTEDMKGLVDVAGAGMGCCVIRRDVIEALIAAGSREHPHQWPYAVGQVATGVGGVNAMGEDISFCVRANVLGFRTYIDADVRVGHVKAFVMTPPEEGPAALRGAPEHTALTEVLPKR